MQSCAAYAFMESHVAALNRFDMIRRFLQGSKIEHRIHQDN